MNDVRALRQADIIALGCAVVLVVFLVSSSFRRELYAFSPPLYWAFDVLKFVIVPATAAFVLARRYDIRPKHYGLRGVAQYETWAHFMGLTVFLALILYLAYYASWFVVWAIFRPEIAPAFYQEINPRGFLRIPVTLYMAITAGVAEEVFFRGLPLLYLERRFPGALPRKTYILGTAILFGFIHWGNGLHEVVATISFGALAAILYLRLRDLWPLIAAHAAIDIGAFA